MGNASSSEEGARGDGTPQQQQQRQHHFRGNHGTHEENTRTGDARIKHKTPGHPSSYQIDTPQTGTTMATATKAEEVAAATADSFEGNEPDDENMHIEYAPDTHEPSQNQYQAQQEQEQEQAATQSTQAEPPTRPGLRRKSTLLLDEREEEEADLKKLRESANEDFTPLSRVGSGEEVDIATDEEVPEIETILEWRQGGHKVYVTGSFTGWRKMIKLHRQNDGTFRTILKLPIGTHRLRFVVDNELLCSNFLPSATDSMGNLVNYIELEPGMKGPYIPSVGIPQTPQQEQQQQEQQRLDELLQEQQREQEQQEQQPQPYTSESQDIDDSRNDNKGPPQPIKSFVEHKAGEVLDDNKYERFFGDQTISTECNYEYCTDIPNVFTDPEAMDRFVSSELVNPPQLPPHLEGVILNSNSNEKDNNSVLPIPNHVVLNHLATTSIKHNVLAVASISRYSRKYVTQILYAPLKNME